MSLSSVWFSRSAAQASLGSAVIYGFYLANDHCWFSNKKLRACDFDIYNILFLFALGSSPSRCLLSHYR